MPPLGDADAPLAAGAPFLAVAEPTLLLLAFASQVEVIHKDGNIGVTVPPGLMETMAALNEDNDK